MRWGRNAHFYSKPFIFVYFYLLIEWIRLEGSTMGHLVQPPCSSSVVLERNAQDCTQMVLEYLWGGRLHTLSGCSVPVQGHYTVKNSSSCSGGTSVHQFLPIALVLLLDTTAQPGPSFWNTPFRYWYTLIRSWLPQPFLLREIFQPLNLGAELVLTWQCYRRNSFF